MLLHLLPGAVIFCFSVHLLVCAMPRIDSMLLPECLWFAVWLDDWLDVLVLGNGQYLTKKFLKKHSLRDYIRVVADSKSSYDLRYFSIQNDEADE